MSDDRDSSGTGHAAANSVTATVAGHAPGRVGSDRSQGEVDGVGSTYGAQLNERPNLSNPRNQGPSRSPSANGAARIPVMTMSSRSTGRKG